MKTPEVSSSEYLKNAANSNLYLSKKIFCRFLKMQSIIRIPYGAGAPATNLCGLKEESPRYNVYAASFIIDHTCLYCKAKTM